MEFFGIATAILIVLGMWAAPFPIWSTYWLLWMAVIKYPAPSASKFRQVVYLIKFAIALPLWGLLWLLDDLLYPAYRKVEVRPVFIVSPPRCGTTLLHRTLASDTSTFFAVSHLEWRYPFIVVHKLLKLLRLDRWAAERSYWSDTGAGKAAAKMHPEKMGDWEEDAIFYEEIFLHHYFVFLRFPYVELLERLESFPELSESIRNRMLDSYQKVLQKVQYLRGSESLYFLSKEVKSHKKIPFYLERFKDARFIVTVRSAKQFISSLIPLLRVSTESKAGIDPIRIAGWQDAVIRQKEKDTELLVTLCRETIPKDRLTLVYANDYIQHIDASTQEVYHSMGLPLNDEYRLKLIELRNHQKKRDRGYHYDKLHVQGFEIYEEFVDNVREQFHSRTAAHENKTENQWKKD